MAAEGIDMEVIEEVKTEVVTGVEASVKTAMEAAVDESDAKNMSGSIADNANATASETFTTMETDPEGTGKEELDTNVNAKKLTWSDLGKTAAETGMNILKFAVPILASVIVPLYILKNDADTKKARELCTSYCIPSPSIPTLAKSKARNEKKSNEFMHQMWSIDKDSDASGNWDWGHQPFCNIDRSDKSDGKSIWNDDKNNPIPFSPEPANQFTINVSNCAKQHWQFFKPDIIKKYNAGTSMMTSAQRAAVLRCTPCCTASCNRQYIRSSQELAEDFWQTIADALGIDPETLRMILIGLGILIGVILIFKVISVFRSSTQNE